MKINYTLAERCLRTKEKVFFIMQWKELQEIFRMSFE